MSTLAGNVQRRSAIKWRLVDITSTFYETADYVLVSTFDCQVQRSHAYIAAQNKYRYNAGDVEVSITNTDSFL